jgi:hypothetical protein
MFCLARQRLAPTVGVYFDDVDKNTGGGGGLDLWRITGTKWLDVLYS